jgi:hypothetical protein
MPNKLLKERTKKAAMMIEKKKKGCYLHPKLLAMIVGRERTPKALKRG